MRIALTVALTAATACIAGCLWLIGSYHVDRFFGPDRRTTFLWGDLDSARVYSILSQAGSLALLAALLVGFGLTKRLTGTAARRLTRAGLVVVLVIGAPVAGLHVLTTIVRGNAVYTEIEGIDRDLVVREWSLLLAGGGDVFEREGSSLTLIGTTGADDGQTPFARGQYTAIESGGVVTLEWEFEGSVWTRLVIGDPTLPPSPYDGLYHYGSQN